MPRVERSAYAKMKFEIKKVAAKFGGLGSTGESARSPRVVRRDLAVISFGSTNGGGKRGLAFQVAG
jgi:hypothetical protein